MRTPKFTLPRFSLAAASLGVAAVVSFAPTTALAVPIASDSFAVGVSNGYTVGNLTGQNPSFGASGFSANWSPLSGSTSDLVAETGGLTASLVQGSTQPGQASHIGTGNNTRANYHRVSSVPASTEYYFSFLLSSTAGNAAQFGLSPQGAQNALPTQGVRVGVTAANNIVLYVDGLPSTILTGYTPSTTYFVLVDIANVAGTGNDTVGARVFSSTATDLSTPLGTATPITTADISGDLTYLGLSKNATTSTGADFDEFRFGTTIADVANITAVPEPSSVAMLLGGFGLLVVRAMRRRRLA